VTTLIVITALTCVAVWGWVLDDIFGWRR